MNDTQNTPSQEVASSTPELDGFTQREIADLNKARERFLSGELNELSGDYKRLRFARWLYEHGRIES
jgi:hypothetical protein